MHSYVYGLTELRWVTEDEGFDVWPIRSRWFCTPAVFSADSSHMWSVCLALSRDVYPGDVTNVPVTTLVAEEAQRLLIPGTQFRLTRDGTTTLALGTVLSTERVDEEEHRRRTRSGAV